MSMAAVKRRLEGEIEISAGGGEAFHDLFAHKPYDLANVKHSFIQGIDLLHGAFGIPCSIIRWRYTIDGKAQSDKQKIEGIDEDEESKMLKFKELEGDLENDYKNFVAAYHVIPKNEETSTVKWVFEYEKLHQGIPEPTPVMDALLEFATLIDDYYHHCPK